MDAMKEELSLKELQERLEKTFVDYDKGKEKGEKFIDFKEKYESTLTPFDVPKLMDLLAGNAWVKEHVKRAAERDRKRNEEVQKLIVELSKDKNKDKDPLVIR